MLQSLLLPFLLAAAPPSAEPQWVDVPSLRASTYRGAGSLLIDIDSRLDSHGIGQLEGRGFDADTYGHEGVHMVQAWVRNKQGGRVNAFYVGNGKAAILREPRTTIQRAASFVPAHLRGGRFNLYLVQQTTGWNAQPLYLLDEWNAYVMGCAVALSQAKEGLAYSKGTDSAVGQIEFIPYVLAVYIAASEDDPAYVAGPDGEQFRRFVRWNVQRALRQYEACQTTDGLKWFCEVRVSSDARLKAAYDRIMGVSLPQTMLPTPSRLPQSTLPVMPAPIRQTPTFLQDCSPGGT